MNYIQEVINGITLIDGELIITKRAELIIKENIEHLINIEKLPVHYPVTCVYLEFIDILMSIIENKLHEYSDGEWLILESFNRIVKTFNEFEEEDKFIENIALSYRVQNNKEMIKTLFQEGEYEDEEHC